MSILARFFKQKDYENAEHWGSGWENAKKLQEVVITTVESIVILAALNIAVAKQFNWTLAVINGVVALSLMSYLTLFFKYALNSANEKFGWIKPGAFAWAAGILSLAISLAIALMIPRAVSIFIAANFMQ